MNMHAYIHTCTLQETRKPIRPIGAVAEASLDVPLPQSLPHALIVRTTSLISGMGQTGQVTS